jgi:DNA-binding protein
MALAEGVSRIKIGKNITDHVRAALYVIDKFIPEAKVKILDVEVSTGSLTIQIEGIFRSFLTYIIKLIFRGCV